MFPPTTIKRVIASRRLATALFAALVLSTGLAQEDVEREGYFVADPDSTPGRAVFNRTVGLRDTWAKGGR